MKLIPSPGQGYFGGTAYTRLHTAYPFFIEGSQSSYIRTERTKDGIGQEILRFFQLVQLQRMSGWMR